MLKFFDFLCEDCGDFREYYTNFEPPPICKNCGSGCLTKKITISCGSTISAFKSGFYDIDAGDPVRVDSKRQLKRELDKRDLRSFYTHC